MKMRNSDDTIQYCMRLNLNNPEHLEVHNVLQGLNRTIHKSQNNYMISALLNNIRNSPDEELLTDAAIAKQKKGRYVTKRELEEATTKLRTDVMSELVLIMCSVLSKNSENSVVEVTRKQVNEKETNNLEDDETLKSIALGWS